MDATDMMSHRLIRPRLAALGLLALAACKSAGSPAPSTAVLSPAPTGIDPSLLDAKVSPCEDFYAYACGGWVARTPIPADQPRWSRGFSEVEERNLNLLHALLEEMAAGKADSRDLYGPKVADYYAACMDEDGIERRGTRDLLAAWARLDALRDGSALAGEVALLHRNGVFPLFEVGSQQDARDATQVIGVVAQGGLSLPDRDYYLQDDPRSPVPRRSPCGRRPGCPGEGSPAPGPHSQSRIPWAELIRRVFLVDLLTCDQCGGIRDVRAIVPKPSASEVLESLGILFTPLSVAKARDPPSQESFDLGPTVDGIDPIYPD